MPSSAGKEMIVEGTGPMDKAAQLPQYSQFVAGVEDWGEVWTRLFIVQYKQRRVDFSKAPGLRVSGS
jgi:hypothetical protein